MKILLLIPALFGATGQVSAQDGQHPGSQSESIRNIAEPHYSEDSLLAYHRQEKDLLRLLENNPSDTVVQRKLKQVYYDLMEQYVLRCDADEKEAGATMQTALAYAQLFGELGKETKEKNQRLRSTILSYRATVDCDFSDSLKLAWNRQAVALDSNSFLSHWNLAAHYYNKVADQVHPGCSAGNGSVDTLHMKKLLAWSIHHLEAIEDSPGDAEMVAEQIKRARATLEGLTRK